MRYFYKIKTGSDLILDEEGGEWPNIQAAKAEAIEAALEMLADAALRGIDVSGRWFEILNSDGQVVSTLPFKEALLLETAR